MTSNSSIKPFYYKLIAPTLLIQSVRGANALQVLDYRVAGIESASRPPQRRSSINRFNIDIGAIFHKKPQNINVTPTYGFVNCLPTITILLVENRRVLAYQRLHRSKIASSSGIIERQVLHINDATLLVSLHFSAVLLQLGIVMVIRLVTPYFSLGCGFSCFVTLHVLLLILPIHGRMVERLKMHENIGIKIPIERNGTAMKHSVRFI
mmetsp:Transcript_15463/g.25745  ORF Transcript_15463/g.25745 Transcript_15463/m.25745 type:complete len:208 (+) Transcript_15463:151-774(+)